MIARKYAKCIKKKLVSNRSSDLILTIQPGDLSAYSHVLEDRLIH